jgi:primosomal protein N' (replication factor Y)
MVPDFADRELRQLPARAARRELLLGQRRERLVISRSRRAFSDARVGAVRDKNENIRRPRADPPADHQRIFLRKLNAPSGQSKHPPIMNPHNHHAVKLRLVDLALEAKSGGADAIYTYGLAIDAKEGDALMAPLGTRAVMGYAIRVYEQDEEKLGFPIEKLRWIEERIEGLSLPPPVVSMVRYTADQTLSPLPVALAPAMPSGIKDRIVSTWSIVDPAPDTDLSQPQKEVLDALQEAGGHLAETRVATLAPAFGRALKALRAKGFVRQSLAVQPSASRRKTSGLFRLTADGDKIEAFLRDQGRKRPAQALTLMRMQAVERAALSVNEIRALGSVSDAIIKSLVSGGLLEEVAPAEAQGKPPPTPTADQERAIAPIAEAVRTKRARRFLLYGVTGSGKTEVFLRCAAEALKQGRQVLYLVPEIALAAQAIAQLRERFGDRVALVHSDLSAGERLETWLRIREGRAPVVLGARSALFAPLSNLGLIIMDEEHESAYKQESSPRYHGKRLALFLGEQHQCPVVLGSATPSIESYFEAQNNQLELLTLPGRAAVAARLPEVFVDDLGAGYRAGQPAIVAPLMQEYLTEVLERGEQAILFLNRRAYAPFLICRDCGHTFKCPRCSVALSYSRKTRRLRCHHCDHQEAPPDECPKCGGIRLNPFGIGTEKVEESVAALFPRASVARLDRDVAAKKGALEQVLASFRSGDTDILVGTQMVAKGLDFPNVTLVGVIAADTSLGIPDFRASERTFQLLSQVAGRAGRGSRPGRVVIQTFNPLHPAVVCAQDHDFLSFFQSALPEREQAGYPPFRRLVNVVLSGDDYPTVSHASFEAAILVEAVAGVEVLGPVDAPLARLQNKWRRHMLLKLKPDYNIADLGRRFASFKPRGVMVVIDVDAYGMS